MGVSVCYKKARVQNEDEIVERDNEQRRKGDLKKSRVTVERE